MKVKAWRFNGCVFSWSLFRLIPCTQQFIETSEHGPGWALYWLGFEVSFERMVNRGCRLIRWDKATSFEKDNEA